MQISRFRPSTFIACGPFAAQSFGLLLALLLPLQSPAVPQTKLDQSVIQAEQERLPPILAGVANKQPDRRFCAGCTNENASGDNRLQLGFPRHPVGDGGNPPRAVIGWGVGPDTWVWYQRTGLFHSFFHSFSIDNGRTFC